MLTREQLLAPCKRQTETIKFRDGEISVREMSAGELMAFQRSLEIRASKKNGAASESDQETFAAKLLVRCICNKDGTRIMEDSDWETLQQKWSSSELQTILPIATRLNGYASAEGNV